jgi:ubiquinone/menaquinone biosynthesis C-methylase UbiE
LRKRTGSSKRKAIPRFKVSKNLRERAHTMKMVRVEKWFMNSSRHAQRAINRAEKLLPFVEIKGNEKFIEVGCGNGAVSKHIAEEYHLNVTGTDVDPEQIQLAEKKTGQTSNLRFLVSSGTDLPFEENEFDIVLSFGVMHHISNWLDVFAEINGWTSSQK